MTVGSMIPKRVIFEIVDVHKLLLSIQLILIWAMTVTSAGKLEVSVTGSLGRGFHYRGKDLSIFSKCRIDTPLIPTPASVLPGRDDEG